MSRTEIGRHIVLCGSVMQPELDAVLADRRVSVFYSDPPWGNLRYWATINKRMTGEEVAPITEGEMLGRIEELIARYVDGYVFVEYGLKGVPMVHDRLKALPGFEGWQIHSTAYQSGSKTLPCAMVSGWRVGKQPLPEIVLGPDLPQIQLSARCVRASGAGPNSVVLDPFCGMGWTARAAVAVGADFVGNELNSARLAKTIAFLKAYNKVAA